MTRIGGRVENGDTAVEEEEKEVTFKVSEQRLEEKNVEEQGKLPVPITLTQV